jgi:hypothetical protein
MMAALPGVGFACLLVPFSFALSLLLFILLIYLYSFFFVCHTLWRGITGRIV